MNIKWLPLKQSFCFLYAYRRTMTRMTKRTRRPMTTPMTEAMDTGSENKNNNNKLISRLSLYKNSVSKKTQYIIISALLTFSCPLVCYILTLFSDVITIIYLLFFHSSESKKNNKLLWNSF